MEATRQERTARNNQRNDGHTVCHVQGWFDISTTLGTNPHPMCLPCDRKHVIKVPRPAIHRLVEGKKNKIKQKKKWRSPPLHSFSYWTRYKRGLDSYLNRSRSATANIHLCFLSQSCSSPSPRRWPRHLIRHFTYIN